MVASQPFGQLDHLAGSESDEAINLRHLLATLWRRKMIIMGITLVITSITLLVVSQITPLYFANAQIVVEPPSTNVVDIDSVAQSLRTDYYTNETQAAILSSRVLAEKVIDGLHLVDDPNFNPYLRSQSEEPSARFRLRDLIPESWRTALRDFGEEAAEEEEAADAHMAVLSPEQMIEAEREYVTSIFLGSLSVIPSDSSRVIDVGFTSRDPETAARIANATVQAYIDEQIIAKWEQTELANAWLQDRAVELKRRVEASARAMEEHRRSSRIIDIEGSSLLTQQVAELNSQLIEVRSQRAEAEARYKQVERLLDSEDGMESAAAVLQSPLIQRLREQEAEVLRKIAEMKTQYRDGHPKMILARAELQDLVDKIQSEVRKIATNLGNELEIAQLRERNLTEEVERLQNSLDTQTGAEITLRALETELEANQKLYDTILARLKETDVQDSSLLQPDARIISFATIPGAPAHPRKKLIVGISLVGSMMLGLLIVLLLEHLDSGFRTREQLEAVTGVAVLSLVAQMKGRSIAGTTPCDDIVERPHTVLSESFRTLRTALLLSNVDNPPRALLVTSSVPAEGKTTTAMSLARTSAKHGQKCIIIDGDLRKPSLHDVLGVPNDQGLVDYLSRDIPLEDLVRIDFRSGAHYILAGPIVAHSTDLLGSAKMRNLIRALRDAYDFVIIDTPPVLAMSDSLVLQRSVDKTVFVVRCEKTRRETVLAGIRQVRDAGADLAGLVLTQVDMRRDTPYHYGESSYYSGYHDDGGKQLRAAD